MTRLQKSGLLMVAVCCLLGAVYMATYNNQSTKQVPYPTTGTSISTGDSQSKQLEPIEVTIKDDTATETEKSLQLVAGGDNLIHDVVYYQAKRHTDDGTYDFKPLYQQVQGAIEQADVAFLNQETMMSKNRELSNYPCFNSPTTLATDLQEIGLMYLI